jgi:predicted secreted protein
MANEIAGYKAVILFSTSTGGTKTDIASLRNFSIDHSLSTIDVTTHESSGVRALIAGVTQWSGSAETLHVTSNATHKAAFDVLTNKTKVDTEFYPTGSSSDGFWTGECFLTGWSFSSPEEDANAVGITFEGTGALTRSSSST